MEEFKPEMIRQEPEPKNMEAILERAQELGPELTKLYNDFHANPELGGEEVETAAKIKKYLEELGIEIVGEQIGKGPITSETDEKTFRAEGTGLVGIIRGNEGPTVALRADMDALPIPESEEHEVRSKKENVAHLCGHDAHMTSLLGAATILKEKAERGELDGDVVLIFQPSEEGTHQQESGAVQMVRFLEKKGLRDKIGAFLGLHVYSGMERGQIMLNNPSESGGDVQNTSSGSIDINVSGPGGHILNVFERPDIDAIMGRIKERVEDSFRHLHEEGVALVASAETKVSPEGYNVLIEKGERTFVIRIASPEYKEMSQEIEQTIRQTVADIIQEEVSSKGEVAKRKDRPEVPLEDIKVDISIRRGYRPTIHRDPKLVDILDEVSETVLTNNTGDYERDTSKIGDKRFFAGEDFSFYLEKFRGKEIPGVFAMVGAANSAEGINPSPHHSSDFRIDPKANQDLAAIHTGFVLKVLEYLRQQEEDEE